MSAPSALEARSSAAGWPSTRVRSSASGSAPTTRGPRPCTCHPGLPRARTAFKRLGLQFLDAPLPAALIPADARPLPYPESEISPTAREAAKPHRAAEGGLTHEGPALDRGTAAGSAVLLEVAVHV